MSAEVHAVILVHATSHALRAEKVLAGAGIACKLVPVPRHLSSDCGSCIRIDQVDKEAARRALGAAGLEIDAVHDL